MESSLGGIKDMGGLPDVIFVVDVDHEDIAVTEARKLMIPVVGIVDTNSDPEGIALVIPGTADAIRSIRLFVSAIADAVIAGKAEAQGSVRQDEFVELTEAATGEPEAIAGDAAPAETGDIAEEVADPVDDAATEEAVTPTSE